ncbi:hypothetical protein V1J52_22045 [Streptomyces sp. TRM 70351]|uniref:hypothetical protein n=1 Tax=Streptomyces sp. TRM 70351 TaxID=3116552 RepID=UPI002E7C52DF|nr:hypothetical protein [Streptomyces sp. TRM 70351]MEE1930832.1 hypothetical protein [Streptomyces sp. TRM 70351]
MNAQWRNRPIKVFAQGTLVYTAGETVSVVMHVGRSPRSRPRKAVAYTGRFRIDGHEVIHRVSSGTWPFGPGRELRRHAELLTDRCLSLALAPKGTVIACVLVWERTGDA